MLKPEFSVLVGVPLGSAMPLVLRLAKKILGLPHITSPADRIHGLNGAFYLGSFWYKKRPI
jgi:hypothetical protein